MDQTHKSSSPAIDEEEEAEEALLLHATPVTAPLTPPNRIRTTQRITYLLTAISALLIIGVVVLLTSTPPRVNKELVSRIAFGSCTAYDFEPQAVWENGVIPSGPDAWIWLGDFAYMDEPTVNCFVVPSNPQCTCANDWLHTTPFSCLAGDLDHGLIRLQAQLRNPGYSKFLEFMCPGYLENGRYPPPGMDPSACPRAIMGTYDDHDFSWNNGNKRLPQKYLTKQLFLDAIGEPATSPRRNRDRGIEWQYTLNEGDPEHAIDVFLLDERYNRDPLPCYIRRDYCLRFPTADKAWCKDFLQGGLLGEGSCCPKDDSLYHGWCQVARNRGDPLWEEACDPTSPRYAQRMLVVDKWGNLTEPTGQEPEDVREDSLFCDVLGSTQRTWLASALQRSKAPLKLIASSSVLFWNPTSPECDSGGMKIDPPLDPPVRCPCTGDDWECYRPAQLQLLHLLQRTEGCVVVLTGDFHYSDIKVLKPGQQAYSEAYRSGGFGRPLYQVMASGLTTSTGQNFSCSGYFQADPMGLRDHPECDFVRGPSFGMLEVAWGEKDPTVTLQIRDGNSGQVRLESAFGLGDCARWTVSKT